MFALLLLLEIFGIVRDPSGLPVGNATVNTANRSAVTDAEGWYRFVGLAPGTYDLQVTKEGFQSLHRTGIVVNVGQQLRVDLTLPLGQVDHTVQVHAEAPFVRDTRGTVAFTVDRQKVTGLPLDGRNFIPLIALSPGVSLPPGSFLPRINGSRPRVSEYIYDGVSVLQPEPGQVAYYPIIDAIDEFRVETNSYSAEYGRSNGGVILVSQKTGSNQFHGTIFDFFRHEKLNARNLFAVSGAKPQFRRSQHGFVFGGPVQRDRTFFFAEWQGTILATGVVRTATVPSLAERSGAIGNVTIPASELDPVAVRAAERYPLPTGTTAANNYRRVAQERTHQNQGGIRLDRHIGERHRFFSRLTRLGEKLEPATVLPLDSGRTDTSAYSIAAEHTWTPAADRVNQLRVAHTGRGFVRKSFPEGAPAYDIAGYALLGTPSNGNADFSTSVTQIVNTYSAVAGRHSLKAGGDFRWQRLNAFQPANPNGLYQFTSFANFLRGQAATYTIDLQEEVLRPRAKIAEFFLQDDWRVTPTLSLNLGVRYTLNFPSTVKNDRGAVFDLDTQRLRFLGKDGYPRTARNLELGNFGPRVGFAFSLQPSLVMRGGYGMTWIEQAGITTPFTTPHFPFIRTLAASSPQQILSKPPDENSGLGQGVFAVQRDQKSGYAQQWNLSFQKVVATNWSMEVGYLGSKLTNLGVPDVNLNQIPFEALSRGVVERPYPRFTAVALYRNNVGHSTYHSLQSRIEKRYSKGLTFSAAYTFSRLIDDAGAVFDSAVLTGPVLNFQAADSFNRRLEKDVSTGNIPHVFSSGVVYMRGQWQFAAIARAQAGSPVAVTQNPNFNAFAGYGIQRPNRLRDPRLPASESTTGRWFDTSAFQQAARLTIGTSSRNPVVGPGYRTLDVMVGRTFALAESFHAELRAEAFNATNTPPLGNPNGVFGTAAFGTIASAGDPRVFELVLKLRF